MYASPHNVGLRGGNMDVDAMLFEASSRAQLSRQPSNSSSTVAARRSTPRIAKPSSAGNSPVHVQRRRAYTAARRSQYLSELYPPGSQAPQTPFSPAYASAFARPVSWHPSSLRPSRYAHCYNPAAMPALPQQPQYCQPSSQLAYRTITNHGMPTPMTQPDSGMADLPPDSWFSLGSRAPYVQAQLPMQQQHQQLHQQPATAYDLYATKNPLLSAGYAFDVQNPDYAVPALSTDGYSVPSCPSSAYPAPAWPASFNAPYPSAHTAPATPDMQPLQNASVTGVTWSTQHSAASPPPPQPALPKADGTELVGMGLYDEPSRASVAWSEASYGREHILEGRPISGAGLKLEKTWEPPPPEPEADADDASDAEGDASGSDDSEQEANGADEEMDDVSPTGPATPPAHAARAAGKPADLSNQSFFFEADDTAAARMLQEFLAMHEPAASNSLGGQVA